MSRAPSTRDTTQKQIDQNPVITYTEGTPEALECGFSAKAMKLLGSTGCDLT